MSPTSDRAGWCKDVVKTYRLPGSEVRALRGVSAEFPRGALTAVVGPSGSGKSTLLRLVSGLDRPDSGQVEIGGRRVSSSGAAARRRLRQREVTFVFQRPSDNFIPYLTVREHLGLAGEHEDARIAEVLGSFGLEHRADHLPAELSGGEQQRAALAQAVAARAGVVVADEPTAELDVASARELIRVIRELTETGISVVVATHDRALGRAAAHVVPLDHGIVTATRRSASGAPPWGMPGPEVPAPDTGKEVLVEAGDLTKSYARGDEVVHAVAGATFELHPGEIVGLIGRSGSGKTTLLSILAGWEEPDGGRLAWPGGGGSTSSAWEQIAIVPQHLGLIDELSVRANVELPLRLGGGLAAGSSRLDELFDGLGLSGLEDRYPSEISVGEQQRTALARALIVSPRLLLADEPTGHQDQASSRSMFEAFAAAAQTGTCCLVATHNEAIRPYLDRMLLMSDGRLEGPAGG